jgi:metalloendopeptidase OMA1, mitochondrial
VRSDDELAGIIAHEMAHVLARHSAETITRSLLLLAATTLFQALTSFSDSDVTMLLARYLLELPNSRRNESEADAIGIELAARACFRPSGLASALRVRHQPPCCFAVPSTLLQLAA